MKVAHQVAQRRCGSGFSRDEATTAAGAVPSPLTAMTARPSPRNMKVPRGSGLRPRRGAAPNVGIAFPAPPVAANGHEGLSVTPET